MTEKIIVAGAGGQGIMLISKILAEAAMREGKFVTYLPAYGPEVRGGTAHCAVIISDQEIGSPCIGRADTLIILNSPSLERFQGKVKEGGLLVMNTSLAEKIMKKNVRVLGFPFTDLALEIGNIKVANMVALGCYVASKKIVSSKSIREVILAIAPTDKKDLIALNKQALEKGVNLV